MDNASSDYSARILGERFPGVRVIDLEENIGFGRACNLAAREAKGELLLLLNSDALVLGRGVSEIVRGSRRFPHADVWGGRTLNLDGSVATETCMRFPSLWILFCRTAGLARLFWWSDVFNRENYGRWQRDTVRQVDVVSGCWFLIRRTLWERLKGFDPIYFMYSEEVDLCWRARALGARVLFLPDAEIIHHRGLSATNWSSRATRLLKGKVTFMRVHWSPLRRKIGLAILMTWPISRYLAFSAWGLVSRDRVRREAALGWREVWRARHDWKFGYQRDRPEPSGASSRS